MVCSKILLIFVLFVYHAMGLDLDLELSVEAGDLETASLDFGRMSRVKPLAVLHPRNAEDIAGLVKAAYGDGFGSAGSAPGFTVSAKGHGHSINGQAQTADGIVVEMGSARSSRLSAHTEPKMTVDVSGDGGYVDVWGGELWIDVLRTTLQYNLSPKSWTDYLYLSVGGTLSNGGISGQAFNYGPQVNNVYELDVVTGKGELLTCSKERNSQLFYGVLGGLGQFGVITRARIALERAPQRVRWIRVLYSNFITFTRDQEYLISLHGEAASDKFDYVEGFVLVKEGLTNNWRSSFFSSKNPVKLSSINPSGSVLYCLEVTKNYNEFTANTVDQDVDALVKKLNFIPSTIFTTDTPYVDFLDRVHKAELKLRAQKLWDVPRPWLNLFVPKSKIVEFNEGVFKGILGNKSSGPILIYPMNKNKWDNNWSVVTPNEDIFYLVALLRSAVSSGEEKQTLDQNRHILTFCNKAGIKLKQYLPTYNTQEEWKTHFGEKWDIFVKRKMEFDPKHILATGQHIFRPSIIPSTVSSW